MNRKMRLVSTCQICVIPKVWLMNPINKASSTNMSYDPYVAFALVSMREPTTVENCSTKAAKPSRPRTRRSSKKNAQHVRVTPAQLYLCQCKCQLGAENLRVQRLHRSHGRKICHRWDQPMAHDMQRMPDVVAIKSLLRRETAVLGENKQCKRSHANHYATLVRGEYQLSIFEPI